MISDYLYVYNADGLEKINVRGVFEDPRDLVDFKECTGGGCYSDDDHEFPIPMDMLNLINSGILNGELQLLSGTLSDTANDRMQDLKSVAGRSQKQ